MGVPRLWKSLSPHKPKAPSQALGFGHSRTPAAALGDGDSGSFVEFELANQVSRGDGWSSGWQADGVEECMNDRRLSEDGDHLHPTRRNADTR